MSDNEGNFKLFAVTYIEPFHAQLSGKSRQVDACSVETKTSFEKG
jgi:hypothetical protein